MKMRFKLAAVIGLAAFSLRVSGASNPHWTLVRSSHFEVFSQTGERDGQSALAWLERLRAFFVQAGVTKAGGDLDSRGAVRVIGFESAEEYAPFRAQPGADAYFLSGYTRDYLVLPRLDPQGFNVAAHEYAHLVLRSLDIKIPPWLEEGIAEFFSTVRIRDTDCLIGGDLPNRIITLQRNAWIPLPTLLSASSPFQANRTLTNVFYAESWALTDMLIFAPQYSPRFTKLLTAMTQQNNDPKTVARIYGRSLDDILADTKIWRRTHRSGVSVPGVPGMNESTQVFMLGDLEVRRILADLLLASGKLDQAETAYEALAREKPDDANVHAALAVAVLRAGRCDRANQEWARAMQLGVTDANLCYEYAIRAEDAGVSRSEILDALRKAVALKPDFDDARYKLGLLESSSGDYQTAIQQLRAMRAVGPARAYGYWTAMASALTETDNREEAKKAATEAIRYATSTEERASASRLAYVADTDLTVQLSRDANGNVQMVTARKAHGTDDWNPFVEPRDHIRHFEGRIRNVRCRGGNIVGFRVEGTSGTVDVEIGDPAHILIRGGTPEFVCGAEDGREVSIEYAASSERSGSDGVLRGMRFQ